MCVCVDILFKNVYGKASVALGLIRNVRAPGQVEGVPRQTFPSILPYFLFVKKSEIKHTCIAIKINT